MKKSLLAFAIMAAMSAASFAAGNASFLLDNGQIANFKQARSVEQTSPSQIIAYNAHGSVLYVADNGGSIFARLKALPLFASFVKLPGTNRYINMDAAGAIACTSSGITLGWYEGQSEDVTDYSGSYCAALKASVN